MLLAKGFKTVNRVITILTLFIVRGVDVDGGVLHARHVPFTLLLQDEMSGEDLRKEFCWPSSCEERLREPIAADLTPFS